MLLEVGNIKSRNCTEPLYSTLDLLKRYRDPSVHNLISYLILMQAAKQVINRNVTRQADQFSIRFIEI